jgi:mannose-1-phosphate guanylyltransferase
MINNKNYYAVIMAGGVGSRFWPMSTSSFPKQFHDMLGVGQSLIQRTFERINDIVPSTNILIATNERYEDLVLEQLPKTTKKQLLLEPEMRNTAPCILYAALKIYAQNKDAVMLVAPSDHWIDDETEFTRNIARSFKACAEQDILMTLGIQPDAPNTGYGYIKFEGDYLWNAGIFVWSAKSIIKAFTNSLPEMVTILDDGNTAYNSDFEDDFIKNNYAKCENISIDFGIMEKAKNVHVLPVDFGWNDLGTWGSLYNKLEKDATNNAVVGANTIFRDANGNMIRTQSGKKVVIQGLKDFIVVEKEEVLLICPKEAEQDIKQIVTEVRDTFGDEFV